MTTNHDPRWSAFTLDAHWMAGQPADAALEEHLATCDACRAYLAALEASATTTAHDPPRAAPMSSPRRARSPVLTAAWAAGAVALAASMVLLVRTHGASEAKDDYVGIKGTPAVQVIVHRGDHTEVWDGEAPVHPGDALALRVVCEGLTHAVVATRESHTPNPQWIRLSDAPCPANAAVLPFTLEVDDEPGDERVAVVLSRAVLDHRALQAAAEGTTRSGSVWTVRFLFHKSEVRK